MDTEPKPKIEYYHDQKDRKFVREVSGEYNLTQELKRLRSLPRVRKGRDIKFMDGPQAYSKHFLEPKDGLGQTLHIHLEEYGPGGHSQKHGHVNEAVFYILDGEGAEVHDGIRYEWEAGDVAIVHNNCVHQHFNRNPEKPARALVLKTKPMFVFMNLLFQKTLEKRATEPANEHGVGFVPREEPHYHDHDHDHDHHHEDGHHHG